MSEKMLLSIQEAAEALGISVSTLYRLTSRRKIPHVKIGSRCMFEPMQLQSWIRERALEVQG